MSAALELIPGSPSKVWWSNSTLYELAADLARANDVVWAALQQDARDAYVRSAETAMRFLAGGSEPVMELLERARDEGYSEAVSDIESEVLMLTRHRRG